MKEKNIDKIKVVLNILVFALALFGGITLLASVYSIFNGRDVIVIGFFKQIIIYVGALTLWIIIGLTEIIPLKVSQVQRIIISGGIFYAVFLICFSNSKINPFQSIELFIINTIWFLLMVGVVTTSWYVYQFIVSKKYTKYLDIYQNKIK
ncbi:hypothetical protein [Clostridium sp.]|uniref:hypothetical protein n=1 Tax=Clostridium sp. TaxID=1506 RepID=UPI003D6CD51F